ncbi:MAG: 16S rRNA (cytosine(1402)-N(4))-methyltransferase RsmH [Phycisphaeraceae bacterium]|nr:MAG: 16S rRNA (cytosine(1402)-N(4))-methyltransferase RsmH [Phycisphaeraceae bacterium]
MPPPSDANPAHVPVLPEQVLGVLSPQPGETYADATAGLGGHAEAVARLIAPGGRVILNDADGSNLERAAERVRAAADIEVIAIHGPFSRLPDALEEQGIGADLVLADLGFASNQVDDPDRGLSFKRDGPLDMRLDPTSGEPAADLLARIGEAELADLIWRFGEERLSRRIARKLVEARQIAPISTTSRVGEIVRSAYPAAMVRKSRIDPATRTFQALRIAVNDEMGQLEALLAAIERGAARAVQGPGPDSGLGESGWLKKGARVAMISFHSLEDRPVKQAFVRLAERGLAERLTRKPITAYESETRGNPRARSAKLRAVRIADHLL